MNPVSTEAAQLLAIDAGNTRIKWGVHDGRGWAMTGHVETAKSASLATAWHGATLAARAIASNVAGTAVAAHLERACAQRGIALQFIRAKGAECGVKNGYRDPLQLGSDRWAALVGAHALFKGAVLVVNAGTALTIDALAADGRFLGGLIVPGPALMRACLDRATAGLRHTEGRFAEFPASTPDAITSGAIQASAGAVARMADMMASHDSAPSQVVLSGGAAGEIAPHLSLPVTMHENLVLDGLVLIARRS